MRKLFPILTLTGTLLLGACASSRPTLPMWEKPGVTTTQWFADQQACDRDTYANPGAFGRGTGADLIAQQFYYRCLESKGYTRTQ